MFKSTQVTQQLIDTHLAFASAVRSLSEISQKVTSLMDKMCHLAITLALDPSVPEQLQGEVIESFQYLHQINLTHVAADGGR